MKNRVAWIVILLLVIVSIGLLGNLYIEDAYAANGDPQTIYAVEDTTIIYEGTGGSKIMYEDGNLGYLDVGYQGTFGVPLEVQVLLKYNLPDIPEGYEVESANLYFPMIGGNIQGAASFSLKASSSLNHDWIQDTIASETLPAPIAGSTIARSVATNAPIAKPVIGPFDFTSYVSNEIYKTNPRATFILSAFTAEQAAAANITFLDHYIQSTETHMGGTARPYLMITYTEMVNIEITGVTDGSFYRNNVTPHFNVGTATLNGAPFTLGTTITNEGTYTLTVTQGNQTQTIQFTIDKTRPTATVVINNGSLFTNNEYVNVIITPDSGVNDIVNMRYSVNDSPISTTQSYYSPFSIGVGSENGEKTVSVELIDAAGNKSPLYSWDFALNTTIPTGNLTINSGAAYTTKREVDLLIAPDTGANEIVSMRFSTDNIYWSTIESYNPSKTYTLPSGDGNKTVYVQLLDRFGNLGVLQSSILLDMTPPTASVLINNGDEYANNINVAIEITPDTGVNDIAAIRYTLNGLPPTTIAYTNSFAINVGSTNGEKEITITLIDAAGHTSTVYRETVTLDTLHPTGAVAINGGAAYATDAEVSLGFSLGVNVDDVVGVQFSNDDQSWSVQQSYSASTSYTLPTGDGNKTVYVRFIDRAGNIGTAQASIVLDTTAPTGTLTLLTPSITNSTEVSLTVTGSDAAYMELGETGQAYGARVTYSATPQAYTLQDTAEDGVKTIQVRLTDLAGNTTVLTQTVTLDRIDPTGTVVVNDGEAYTKDSDVVVSVTPAAGVTDIASIRYSVNGGSPTTIAYTSSFQIDVGSTNEAKAITVRLIDGAGNESPVYSSSVTLDTKSPTGMVTINEGAAYTTDVDVALDFTLGAGVTDVVYVQFSNDNLTWSSELEYSAIMSYTLPTGDGSKTVYVRFIDRAGNTGTAEVSIILDTTLPIGTMVINNNDQFSNSLELEITLTTPDPSDIAGIQFSSDGTTWSALEAYKNSNQLIVVGNGEKTVHVKFIDKAGNEFTTSSSIYVDTVKPVVSISIQDGAVITLDEDVSLTINASDPGRELETVNLVMELSHDGISWLPVENYIHSKAWTVSSGFGTKQVYVRITDEAQNVSNMVSASIVYRSIPQLENSTVTAKEDTQYSFGLTDFQYTNEDAIVVDSYTIVSLPQHGLLTLEGKEVVAGTVVTAAELAKLIYVPELNWFGSDQLIWHASADNVMADVNATLIISVASVNDIPSVEKFDVTKTDFSKVQGTLVAQDVEGDSLTYYIVDAPLEGKVTLNELTGEFEFVLDRNVNGTYTFTYRVFDGIDYSNTAIVTIKYAVSSPTTTPTPSPTSNVNLKFGENGLEVDITGQVNIQGNSISIHLTENQLTQLSAEQQNQPVVLSVSATYPNAQLVLEKKALEKLVENGNSIVFSTTGVQYILSNQELKQMLTNNHSSFIINIQQASADLIAKAQNQALKGAYQLIGTPVTIELLAQNDEDSPLNLPGLGQLVLSSTNIGNNISLTMLLNASNVGDKISPTALLKFLPNGELTPILAAISINGQSYQVDVTNYGAGTYTLISKQPQFTDVSGWSKDAIELLASKLILNGVDTTNFEPDRAITRAEFASIISKALGLVNTSSSSDFTDITADAWYADAIATVAELGFMNGYTDGTYRPSQQLTREEAMVIVARVLSYLETNLVLSSDEIDNILTQYGDQDQLGNWSRLDIALTVREGIINGNNGQLNAKDNITREQIAAIIVRLLERTELL
ncbi:S-layer homology domain-containing protein [Paenibacillus endoradicis]|uniref:S-layer homology domain-containing protein n=1 Tax=Paenibacillus endoradicis TaxID=2972487 RepID=UPI002159A409|nr:S-layer homology domain-containing protein [Paenibacillus endoradicis]MCR8657150.1 S-layer homology domain-containing protein [Paenibacillus endoradicis]